jgi:uncharacterized protein YqfB (UPF0267 family)
MALSTNKKFKKIRRKLEELNRDRVYKQIAVSDLNLLECVDELKKYGYTIEFVVRTISTFNSSNISFDPNDMIKVADFVDSVLKCYGYSEEEIVAFFARNKRIVISSYSDFVRRLEIFNHFDFMDKVLFGHYNLLTKDLDSSMEITTAQLYAICMGHEFKSLEELKSIIEKILPRDLNELVKRYPLTGEVIRELNNKFRGSCAKLKLRSDLTKRLKNKNGGIN